MVRICITFVFLFSVLLFSCNKSDQHSPADYNDFIVNEIESAADRMRAFYAPPSKSAEQLDGVRNYLLASIERIENEDFPEKPTHIRKASKELLTYYLQLCEKENLQLLQLTDPTHYTPEDSIQAQELIVTIIKETNLLNGDFVEAQKKFATSNNLLLINQFTEDFQ